jgi:Flp pilus assembly protein TadG
VSPVEMTHDAIGVCEPEERIQLWNGQAGSRRRRRQQSGNAILEAALIMTPFLALMLGVVELSLPLFKKSVFTAAVREGCRYGITYQTSYQGTTYGTQTQAIQAVVQNNAMGFLNGTTGLNQIKVQYFLPVSPFTEVTGTPTANGDGNVLQVSVQGYVHAWIAPVLWFWGPINFSVTNGTLTIAAISADRLESLPGGSSRPAP